MWSLSVEGIPACGAPVTDTSVEPRTALVLEPAPAAELETEYRWITDTAQGQWRAALPIGTSGRSIAATHARLADLRAAYAGFAGFDFRLKDEPDVTAQCTWPFTGDGDDDGSTPAVRLSASPNPVTEGSPVTVTARLSSALASDVTIPLSLANVTAEDGDYGSLASITISAGQTTGTGTISTAEDDDPDDETFTVGLGSLPSSVTAGSPSSVTVTIRDTTPSNRPPTVEASCDPCDVRPGSEVRLTATASDPDGDPLRYRWSAPRGAFMGASDEAAARWRAPAETGRVASASRSPMGGAGRRPRCPSRSPTRRRRSGSRPTRSSFARTRTAAAGRWHWARWWPRARTATRCRTRWWAASPSASRSARATARSPTWAPARTTSGNRTSPS